MKEKKARSAEDNIKELERRWLRTSRPKQKAFSALNTIALVLLLAALCVAIVLNRRRLGALWQQVTGKAPPLWVQPEPPEREGPEIEGRDF
jgi:hypothetical protein